MMSVTLLAQALGISARRARELCFSGLPGVALVGRTYVVIDEAAALAAARARNTKRGPRKSVV
jgi:hypothetical protein